MFFANLITDWIWPGDGVYSYHWFHIMWLVLMVIGCFASSYFLGRKHNKKIDDRFIFIIGTMLILIEIYKQVFYTLDAGYFQWYAFPFQFCSVPMYVAFVAPLIKNEKIKEYMYKFLASFGLLAGIAVMIYPDSCFATKYITILIHTMLWHSSMVVMGVYLIVARGYGKNLLKEITPGAIIFSIIVTFALIANIIAYKVYFGDPIKNIHNEKFFLLYISPYYETPFPILCDIKEKVPFVIFFITYLLAFFLGVSLLWSIVFLIRKAILKITNKNNAKVS